MANISVFTTTATSIEVIVSYLDTSNPEKRLEFFVDGSYDGYMDVDAVEVAGIGVDYVYTGLSAGYEYNLRVDVYVWDQFDGWVIETSASVRGATDGGGGGGDDPEPPDEWDYQIKDTYNDISDNITVTEHISPGYLLRYKISFAGSGTATFYSTGSTLAPYGALSDSSRFDYTNGVPIDLLEDDGDKNVGENYSFTYDVEAGETYYFWAGGYKLSSYGNLTIHIDPPTGGSSIALWDWNASNGSATAAQTRLAYAAITSHGSLSDFSYKVWNDLCSKVNEICTELGRPWHIGNYLPYGETLMSDQDKVLTAIRFNALIHQFDHKGYVSTGIEEQQIGDTVFGSYFLTITECINDWIEKL